MDEFITLYTIDRKGIDTRLCARGFIRKASIDFVAESEEFKDYYFTNLLSTSDEPLYIKKTDFEKLKIKNYYWMTIKECIELLSTDGKGTKQKVKQKLEELIKDAKD